MTAPFQILCVCTGNVCRSPAAERLLAAALGPEVTVSSAGTMALAGHWIESPMDRMVVLAGGDVSGFAARTLREPMLRGADLVLTLTDAHTGDVIEMWPRAVRKTFTLREFARLLAAIPAPALPSASVSERLRAAIPLARAHRRPQADRQHDDVVDPYRQPEQVYERAFDAINDAVRRIAGVIVVDREQERL